MNATPTPQEIFLRQSGIQMQTYIIGIDDLAVIVATVSAVIVSIGAIGKAISGVECISGGDVDIFESKLRDALSGKGRVIRSDKYLDTPYVLLKVVYKCKLFGFANDKIRFYLLPSAADSNAPAVNAGMFSGNWGILLILLLIFSFFAFFKK